MAHLITLFYNEKEDSLYSDGDIENKIYERVLRNDKTLENDPEWAVFYHFSRLRHNILNWYPFKKNSSILEIGGGCGALTGMLCQRAAHVTSCELTMRRARILYERHKDAKNLEVCVGNFLNAQFDRKFDYVVINGVLEYASGIMGTDHENPFVAFLKRAKSYLKPDGKILLAIENRFGLKYLAGAPEDHIGKIFAGINGYKNGSYVKTFSRQELSDLCEKAKLSVRRWYYPYPDYKFPTEIFTDATINRIAPSTADIPFDMIRAELLDKEAVYRAFMRSEIAQHFSNSFLLEIGETANEIGSSPTYIKIGNNRDGKFSVCTLLYEKEGYVEKKALYPQGNEHIARMADNVQARGVLNVVSTTYHDGSVLSPFVHDKSLRSLLEKRIEAADIDGLWQDLARIRGSLYGDSSKERQEYDPEFEGVFGFTKVKKDFHWQRNVNIDLNVDNIFCGDSQWTVIDNEWVFDFKIPAEFALWRMLYQLQESGGFATVISNEHICHFLEIGQEEIDVFKEWESSFAVRYVGIQDLSVHYRPMYKIDMDEVLEREKQKHTIVSHLFLFFADGSIETLESCAKNDDGKWKVKFCSEKIKDAVAIRWDPLEGHACKISDIMLDELSVEAVNAHVDEQAYTFSSFDPQFNLKGIWDNRTEIEISFNCELIDWTTGYYSLEKERNALQQECNSLKKNLEKMEEKRRQIKEYVRLHKLKSIYQIIFRKK